MAIDLNKLWQLDISSFQMAIHSFIDQLKEEQPKLFINVFPSTFISPLFIYKLTETLEDIVMSPKQIILELSEYEKIINYEDLKENVSALKNMGIEIALDDLGNGNASLKNIVEIKPDYVKFDQYFGKNLYYSKEKQHLLRLLIDFCSKFKIKTILEGIESDRDLEVARSLGVHFGQGYFIGKPEQKILSW